MQDVCTVTDTRYMYYMLSCEDLLQNVDTRYSIAKCNTDNSTLYMGHPCIDLLL